MKTKNILRTAIVCEWIFVALAVVFGYLLEDSLPDLLKEWVRQENEAELTNAKIITALLGIPCLISYFVGCIGLLFLKNWAKWLYLFPFVVMSLCFYSLGPFLTNGLQSLFDDLGTRCSGIILALIFFTNVLRKKAEQEGAM